MAIFGKIFVILTILFFIALVIFIAYLAIASKMEVEKEEEEYKKSLFRYLKILNEKILKEYRYKEIDDEVINEFRDISRKILKLNYNDLTKISNMRLVDSLAYHELNALKELNKALNIGVLLTDEKIQEALAEITKGLNKHYAEFCHIKTANVEEETYILKTLEQKKSERLDFINTGKLIEKNVQEGEQNGTTFYKTQN